MKRLSLLLLTVLSLLFFSTQSYADMDFDISFYDTAPSIVLSGVDAPGSDCSASAKSYDPGTIPFGGGNGIKAVTAQVCGYAYTDGLRPYYNQRGAGLMRYVSGVYRETDLAARRMCLA